VFVDASRAAVQAINANLAVLASTPGYHGQASVLLARAEQWLGAAAPPKSQAFGLVFLDPPFADGVLVERCRQLEDSGVLKPRAHIYVESGEALPQPGLTARFPHNWLSLKSGRAGAVFYGLYQRTEG
jgi:16S rRNA (guanine966-N2)-methyltransferase